MRRTSSILLLTTVVVLVASGSFAQSIAKYGGAFLERGVGARTLAMGGAGVALTRDVTSGYWNVAGLAGIQYPQFAYMHDERFSGIVAFDYGSVAFPINSRSTFGVSFFRSGVDDIPNTLSAWDPIRDQPLPRPENFITYFSATDYAFFVSYARTVSEPVSFGVTGKIIRRTIGDFSSAWGYSFDIGAQYRTGRFLFGANIQDASTMLLSWSTNRDELQQLEDTFGDEIPEGASELVLPVARLGSGVLLPLSETTNLTVGLDTDIRFEGIKSYAVNAGNVSIHPRLGTELSFREVVALRAGLTDLVSNDDLGLQVSPTVGAGLHIRQVALDYGFGNFAGAADDLGYSHRVSFVLTLEQPSLKRAE
ncbi:MAG TPA: PorV/PorQ family protein [Rhodothermia bacterium]